MSSWSRFAVSSVREVKARMHLLKEDQTPPKTQVLNSLFLFCSRFSVEEHFRTHVLKSIKEFFFLHEGRVLLLL